MTIPKIPQEELEKLRVRTPIAFDDPDSVSTAAGWARFQEESKRHRDGAEAADERGEANFAAMTPETVTNGGTKTVLIQAGRFYDARAFARMLFGLDARCQPWILPGDAPAWQLRWEGSALDPHNAPHLVARKMPGGKWRPVRDMR